MNTEKRAKPTPEDPQAKLESITRRRTSYRRLLPGLVATTLLAIVPLTLFVFSPQWFDLTKWAAHQQNLGEIFAALFGLSLTVVAIVVQLAAQRYSPQIVMYFVRDPINAAFFAFIVGSSLLATLAPAIDLGPARQPLVHMAVAVVTCMAFAFLIPYFVYVFVSVQPDKLVSRIRRDIERRFRHVGTRTSDSTINKQTNLALGGLHRMVDIGASAIEHSDRALAIRVLSELRSILLIYAIQKNTLPERWFIPPGTLDEQFAEPLLHTMQEEGTWFESVVCFELEHIERRATEYMPELCAPIGALTRSVAELALEHNDDPLVTLMTHFFNTQIRHGINARNLRVIYAALEHYRRLIEQFTDHKPARAIRSAKRLVEYGAVAHRRDLSFATSLIGHDLRKVCLHAYDIARDELGDRLVKIILMLDDGTDAEGHKHDYEELAGVRKAQIILAVELLERGRPEPASWVADDMRDDPQPSLYKLYQQLRDANEQRFWELTDRGENFEYLNPALHRQLNAFFDMLGVDRSRPTNFAHR